MVWHLGTQPGGSSRKGGQPGRQPEGSACRVSPGGRVSPEGQPNGFEIPLKGD